MGGHPGIRGKSSSGYCGKTDGRQIRQAGRDVHERGPVHGQPVYRPCHGLCTYEQFQNILEKENPQISLLFNTSQGYFAFCVIAPHSLLEDAGTPLKVHNELSEIEKYLKKREDSRQKILVVDDSITIRQGIKQLLCVNYDVSVASSATSAIRAITLNRPDLVLLDYEMPVCDGKHVFEMLRAEEEFADIPIIFLTSKGDEEIVTKILSLKPEGYLLKYLKSTEIKRRIDEYLRERVKKTR